jgi:hypothetical protein
MSKPIILEPKYELGEEVRSVLDNECHYLVVAYRIEQVKDGVASSIYYICNDENMNPSYYTYKEYEIESL